MGQRTVARYPTWQPRRALDSGWRCTMSSISLTTRRIVRGNRIVMPSGTRAADVLVEHERIAAIEPHGSLTARGVIDAAERLVIPGLVDSHVHTRDPGQTHKEDFRSASRAAARGGVTTIMAMPNTAPLVDGVRGFDAAAEAGNTSIVDFAIQALAHASSLENIPALAERGAVSFELFLGGGPPALITRERAMQNSLFAAVAATGGLMGLYPDDPDVSAELECGGDAQAIGRAHPAEVEAGALMTALALAAARRCRVHVRQASTALSVMVIAELRRRAMADFLSAEVTPHHLVLTTEDFIRFGPQALIMPPLRSENDVSALWSALERGIIATIGSDHAPHHMDEKNPGRDDLRKALPGFPGLETFLPAVLTECRRRGLSDQVFVRAASETPARLFGLDDRKGAIVPGLDADLVIVDDQVDEVIDCGKFLSKAKYSPFHGRRVSARVDLTMVRGEIVYAGGAVDEDVQRGRLLRRHRTRR
jgi:dihydroorotase (multifunctional complex type)